MAVAIVAVAREDKPTGTNNKAESRGRNGGWRVGWKYHIRSQPVFLVLRTPVFALEGQTAEHESVQVYM